MLEGILIGLQTALSLQNLLMVIGGCLIGTFIGMLPGLGPMSIIAIMIPIAISLGDPSAALILLAGVYYGAIFGGRHRQSFSTRPVSRAPSRPALTDIRWRCRARQARR